MNKTKLLKIIIPISLGVLCGVGAVVGVVISKQSHKINSTVVRKSLDIVGDEINSYFTADGPGIWRWYYRNEQASLAMSYENKSLKKVLNQDKLTAKIDIKATGHDKVTKTIDIQLNWEKISDTQESDWSQITNQMNMLDYYVYENGFPLNQGNIKTYIENWISTDKNTWYETKNNHKINFTTNAVQINKDGWFTENLKPDSIVDGNKSVPMVLKWIKAKDENANDIISAIKKAGYSDVPVFVASVVKKTINDYLVNEKWISKDTKQTSYKFTATKVVSASNSSWTVTIDQDSSLKTESMSFTPFDITLDWKDQKDASSKLSEIDTQIKKNNYDQLISPDTVLTLTKNFIASGTWKFTYVGAPQDIHIQIDKTRDDDHKGISYHNPPLDNCIWTVYTTFKYINGDGKSKNWQVGVLLKWKLIPSNNIISEDILNQYNDDGKANNVSYKFTSNPNK